MSSSPVPTSCMSGLTHATLISQAGILTAFTAAGLAGAVLPLTTPAGTADTISPPNEDRPGK
jgi:hypothetical protein